MTIQSTKPTLTITFDEYELNYLRGITQNYCGSEGTDELDKDQVIRKQLFVAVSRALGYNMLDDGSINRNETINFKGLA